MPGSVAYLAEDVAKATEGDEILNQVMKLTQKGWPLSKKKLDPEFHPYFNRKVQLTIHQGCILCGLRVVIPQSLRKQVLEEVHSAYAGVVRMKSLARRHVWWPQIEKRANPVKRIKEIQPRLHFIHGKCHNSPGSGFILILPVPLKDRCGSSYSMLAPSGQRLLQ